MLFPDKYSVQVKLYFVQSILEYLLILYFMECFNMSDSEVVDLRFIGFVYNLICLCITQESLIFFENTN